MKVVVVGQGYVGLPVAMRCVEVGYDVVGIEVDPRRLDSLRSGNSYVEDIPSEVLATALASGRYRAESSPEDAAGFDVAVITVPTPLRETLPDLSYIEVAADQISRVLQPGATIILESTTYPGTTEEVLIPALERGSGLAAGEDFFVGYSPERIDPGNATWGFINTPKVVSGYDATSLERVSKFYGSLVETVVPVKGLREAELTKLLENTFRHVNIALVNELAVFAYQLEVDVWDSIRAAATKPFGFMPFWPGPGVGGHCLPVDPSYLSWQVRRQLGSTFRFVELANDVNEYMPRYVSQRVSAILNRSARAVNGARVLLLGLSYKRNTGDIREAPSFRLAELLAADGAHVSALDSFVADTAWPSDVHRDTDLDAAVSAADVVVIMTDHHGVDYDRVVASGVPILDTRGVLSGDSVETL
jgi:nucleotide sugar dehydrogenase